MVHDGLVDSGYYCNGKRRRDGALCTQRAGWGTDHAGAGRCKMHGGATPVKHGLYSKTTCHRLAERIRELRDSDDLLELREQIALQTAVIQEYLSGLEEQEEFTPEQARTLIQLVEFASKNVERLHRIRDGKRLTVGSGELQIVLNQVVAILRTETDSATAERIGTRLLHTTALGAGEA